MDGAGHSYMLSLNTLFYFTTNNFKSMKYFLLLLFILSSVGCNHCKLDEEEFSHSCPKAGHGPCFLCDDPANNKFSLKK